MTVADVPFLRAGGPEWTPLPRIDSELTLSEPRI